MSDPGIDYSTQENPHKGNRGLTRAWHGGEELLERVGVRRAGGERVPARAATAASHRVQEAVTYVLSNSYSYLVSRGEVRDALESDTRDRPRGR